MGHSPAPCDWLRVAAAAPATCALPIWLAASCPWRTALGRPSPSMNLHSGSTCATSIGSTKAALASRRSHSSPPLLRLPPWSEGHVQLPERLLELGMVVLRLDVLEITAARGAEPPRPLTDRDQRHFLLEEIGYRNLLRLEIGAGQLHAESDPQVVSLGGVQRRLPDGIEVQSAGSLLHVAPVAPYIEDIHERQGGEFLDALLQRFGARSCR